MWLSMGSCPTLLPQGDEVRVGGFDLVYRNGHIPSRPDDVYSTRLGADIPSEPKIERVKPPAGTAGVGGATGGTGRKVEEDKAGSSEGGGAVVKHKGHRSNSVSNVLGGRGSNREGRRHQRGSQSVSVERTPTQRQAGSSRS